MTDTIDKLAQSFFLALILCSLMNDSYIIIINFTNNTYIKKKVGYIKNIINIAYNLSFNNFKKDTDGNIIIETDNYEVLSDLGSEDDSDNDDETSIKENINKEKYVNIKENILKFHKTTETVETVETIPILQDEGKSTLPEPNKEIVKEPSLEIPSEKVLTPVVKTTPKNVSKPIQKDKDKEKDKRVIKANKKLEKKLHNSINE